MSQAGSQLSSTLEVTDYDQRKGWWLLGLVVPLLPLFSLGFYQLISAELVLYFTPLLIFVLIPFWDYFKGEDSNNFSDEFMQAISNSAYYRRLVQAYVPVQYLSFAVVCWWLATAGAEISWLGLLGLTVSMGIVGGIAINAAHEMGHKSDRFQRWMARVALAQSAYGHFFVEHNRGHHRNVSTPEDPASARYGESLWWFLPRTVVGSARSAWRLERERLERNGLSRWSHRNQNLQAWSLTVGLFGVVIWFAGFGFIGFLVGQALVGIFLLEAVNYLEHYGLLRSRLPNGRYEKCQPHHSWNSNHIVTNLFLYQLQRHSDHHAHPTRPYQLLRNLDGVPNLPAGYAAMVLLSMVPPLWFKVMNPRVLEQYGGEVGLTNLAPRLRHLVVDSASPSF